MRTNLAIALLVFPMVQAVAFGVGLLFLLSTHSTQAGMPWMIAVSMVVSALLAWKIAPKMRSRRYKLAHPHGG